MKKIYQLFIATSLHCLSFLVIAQNTSPVDSDTRLKIFIPNLKSGFEFSASALVVQPRADNLGWGVVTTVLPIPTPQWNVQSFNPNFKAGFNLGARYVFANSGTDIQLNWSYLNSNNTDFVQVDPNSQWISPFSQTGTPPTGGEITGVASLKSAKATLNFNFNSVNLDMGKFVNFGSDFELRFFTGLSSARITEDLVSSFYGAPKVVLALNNKSTYAGVGPRLGLSNSYDVYHGIHLVGQFAGAILIGSMQPAEYLFNASSSDLALVGISVNNEHVSSSSVTQIVPSVDAKLGLSYSYPMKNEKKLTFELGYMGTMYINPLSSYETNTNVIALDSGSLSTSSVRHVPSNFSIAGPYLTVHLFC